MENLIELLPIAEREAFRTQAEWKDDISVNLPDDVLFSHWNEAKQDLYKVLGNNFILSREIEFKATDDLLRRKLSEIYYNYDETISTSFSPVIQKYMDAVNTLWVINDPARRDCHYKLSEGCSIAALQANAWIKETLTIPADYTPLGKDIKIQRGMKIIKVIEKVLKAFNVFDPVEFEKFRIAHSLCLNEKKIKGELCLSIHPLDYATLSDNNCGWESCMRWGEGEYHQGTIEMMNSPYMIVAYMTSSAPFHLEGSEIKWSNKKWRKLFIVSKDLLMGIKAYPYAAEEIELTALDWIKELAENAWGIKYLNKPIKVGNRYTVRCNKYPYDSVYLSLEMNHMYSDISTSPNHWAYFPDNEQWWEDHNKLDMMLSGKSMCLTCGTTYPSDIEHDSLVCHTCGDYSQCDCCGSWYPCESVAWEQYQGKWYCESCAEELYECNHCGKLEYNEEMCYISFCDRHSHSFSIYVCEDCYKNIENIVDDGNEYFIDDFTNEELEILSDYVDSDWGQSLINKVYEQRKAQANQETSND